MKQLSLRSFLKFTFATAFLLCAINQAGLYVFTAMIRAGKLISVTNDGKVGWGIDQDSQYSLNDIDLREVLSSKEISALQRKKILFLGNSVVFGKEVTLEETFAKLVQKKLEQDRKKAESVFSINAGVDGSFVYEEFETFKKSFSKLNPDTVVWIPGRSDLVPKSERQIRRIKFEMPNFSFLDRVFGGFFKLLAARLYFEQSLWQENYMSSPHNAYYTAGLLKPLEPEVRPDLEKGIDDFVEYLNARNIKLLVVFLPPRMFSRLYAWNDTESFREIDAMLTRRGIPTINLFEQFRNPNTNLYSDYVHLNKAGHQMVATEMAEFLKKALAVSSKHPEL